MEAVFGWISTYGYAGIFFALVLGIVGLPIPDETVMVFCGYLISTGRLHPVADGSQDVDIREDADQLSLPFHHRDGAEFLMNE